MLWFSRKSPMKFNSAQDVLAGVPRSPEHATAEKELAELRERDVSLSREISAASAKLGDPDTMVVHSATQEILRLDASLKRCRQAAGQMQRKIADMTPAYALKVRAAVAVQRRAAPERVKGALADYAGAAADLKTINDLLGSVGASQKRMLQLPFLKDILHSADAIVQECDADLKSPSLKRAG